MDYVLDKLNCLVHKFKKDSILSTNIIQAYENQNVQINLLLDKNKLFEQEIIEVKENNNVDTIICKVCDEIKACAKFLEANVNHFIIETHAPLAYNFISQLHKGLFDPKDDNESRIKMEKSMALLQYEDDNYSWEFATLMVLSVRQLSGSSLAIDILSNIVPGACSSRTFQNRTKQFINRIKSSGQNILNDSYLHVV